MNMRFGTVRRSLALVLGVGFALAWAPGCSDGDSPAAPSEVGERVTATGVSTTLGTGTVSATTAADPGGTSARSPDVDNPSTVVETLDTTDTSTAGNAATCSTGLDFEHLVIDENGPVDVWQKAVADLNLDGRVDLIAGGQAGGGLVWYESPTWTRHEIAPGGGHSTDGESADVDGDQDPDVVSLTRSGIMWYDNPTWASHVIDTRTLHDVEVADFDGDGDVDIVARDQGAFGGSGGELHFYEQESPTSWSHRGVTIPDGEGLLAADLDGDGDSDVVIGGRWYENTGDVVNGAWTEHLYGNWSHPHTFVSVADLNGDGRPDVVLAPAELAGQNSLIAWYESPDDPVAGEWREHVIEADVEAVHHFVGAADFDRDGNMDVAAAEMQQGADPDEVKVFINGGQGGSWSKSVVSTDGSHSMRIVDADGDALPDLFGANHRGSNVDLWLNRGCTS